MDCSPTILLFLLKANTLPQNNQHARELARERRKYGVIQRLQPDELKCYPLSALRYLEPHWYMKKLPNQARTFPPLFAPIAGVNATRVLHPTRRVSGTLDQRFVL